MSPPLHVVIGPPRHGVTRYGAEIAEGVGAPVHRTARLDAAAVRAAVGHGRAHVHLADGVLGSGDGVEDSLRTLGALVRAVPTTVTLHDVPLPTDGAERFRRRRGLYRSLVSGTAGVVCNSEHERRALAAAGVLAQAEVVPLPVLPLVDVPGLTGPPRTRTAEVGLLGFVYPGKGHAEVVDAVALLRRRGGPAARVTALGGVADGHDADVHLLRRHAERVGVPFEVTGYLDPATMARRMDGVTVPVAAHRNVSASGSVNSWLARRRRPVVLDGRYTREMAALRPGTLRLVRPGRLAESLGQALAEPERTWLPAAVSTRPHLDDAVAAYRSWWASR